MREIYLSILFSGLAGLAQADPAQGVWKTEPDKKGIVAHVKVYQCGGAVCGTITRTFDSKGQEIRAASLGAEVIRNATPAGDGSYKGKAFIPAFGEEFPASMVLAGNRLTVKGCAGPVCMSQRWTRLQ